MTTLEIRPEERADIPAISALTKAAFRDVAHSDGSEVRIVEQLRKDGDLALSLVAVSMDQAIIGHIAFSPVTISDGTSNWFGLGPISVIPLRQKNGIGAALIKHGLEEIRKLGAKGVVLLGDPAYYSRFGFEHDPELAYPGPPPTYFQRLVLEGEAPKGEVSYAPAFDTE